MMNVFFNALFLVVLTESFATEHPFRTAVGLASRIKKQFVALNPSGGPAAGMIFPGDESKNLVSTNEETVKEVIALIDEHDEKWSPVVESGRCKVWRRVQNSRHACILAKGVIEAPASTVYDLFEDATKAKDFNEYCEHCRDTAWLDSGTKVSWSATKPIGIFKPRDFVTLCHFTQLQDGSRCIVNRAIDHPTMPPSNKYQRAEIVIAANIVRPLPDGRSHLTLLTQVNPRGAIDTPLGAKIANQLVKKSPVQFFEQIEKAALAQHRRFASFHRR